MVVRDNSSSSPAARAVAVGIALILFGLLFLDQAFSNAVFGRLITHAWVAGIVGLMLLIPGTAVIGYAMNRSLTERRRNDR